MSKLFQHFSILTGFSFNISTIACRVSADNFTGNKGKTAHYIPVPTKAPSFAINGNLRFSSGPPPGQTPVRQDNHSSPPATIKCVRTIHDLVIPHFCINR
ncbi:unnamed protein product [Rhizophagus irregularis]|uniref:Uncharacterized protein n=1 Tax=Rhizophagus irregularis TaxID=588596 RepID=A0A915ZE64_9GLOM|nr:unnamed protein product [Rhizophagus irregularis]